MKISFEEVKTVLVIGLSCIGDTLLTVPAIRNLKYCIPQAHFTLWAGPSVINVLKNDPMWDNLVSYDRSTSTSEFYGLKGRIQAIKLMRKEQFDLVIDLRETLMPLFSGAHYAPLLAFRKPFLYKTIHEAERVIQKIHSLGVPIVSRQMYYFIPDEATQWADEILKSRLYKNKSLVLINPGGRPHKRWPARNFIQLSQKLIKQRECVVGILGYSGEEQEIASLIIESLPKSNILNLSGRIPMPQIAAFLKKSSLFVTNDSGPLHLASAVGVPTVAIYGPSKPDRFGPWGNRHRIILPSLPCAPCDEGEKCMLGDRLKCLNHVLVEKVYEASEAFLL